MNGSIIRAGETRTGDGDDLVLIRVLVDEVSSDHANKCRSAERRGEERERGKADVTPHTIYATSNEVEKSEQKMKINNQTNKRTKRGIKQRKVHKG